MRIKEQLQSKQKVLLVVHDRSILAMLRNSLVQFDHNVVASADNSIGAVKLFKETEPNVVVLDKNLADVLTGVELADLMENIDPNIQLIFLTSFKDEHFTFKSRNQNPKDYIYLPKQEITSAKIVSDLILQSSNSNKKSNRRLQGPNAFDSDLNDREIDLMQHIASGYSNIKIARLFMIEVKSCENAISRLLKKLKIPADSETNQRILVARKYFELSGIVIV